MLIDQIPTIIILTAAAIISAVTVSFLATTNMITTPLFQQQHSTDINKLEDSKGDTKLIGIYKTEILPVVRDYHDILSASINKIDDGNKMILTIELAGDANKNQKYETAYLWLIFYTSDDDNFNLYTIIIPNFPADSDFGNRKGWYMSTFNNTNNSYTLPLSKISDMPKDKVQVFIDPSFIGNPSSFNYIVSSMVRVNTTFLDKPPDYLVDTVPDSNEVFWRQWFS
jgi:hypothetical protein